jgi:hypothetical protein
VGVREIRYCDISGTEKDVESHELQVDQMRIQIDLAEKEYGKLLDLLRPYLDVGRIEASVPELPRRRAQPSGTALTVEQRQQVREWAEAKGIEVPLNNRFKRTLVDQWKAETQEGQLEFD